MSTVYKWLLYTVNTLRECKYVDKVQWEMYSKCHQICLIAVYLAYSALYLKCRLMCSLGVSNLITGVFTA